MRERTPVGQPLLAFEPLYNRGPAVLAVPWLSVLARLVQRRRARTASAALTADV